MKGMLGLEDSWKNHLLRLVDFELRIVALQAVSSLTINFIRRSDYLFRPICRASVMILALLAWNGAASATLLTIFFSIDSSADPGALPPASALDATITVTFDADNPATLTIDFDNMSSGLLTQLYFTTSSNVTGFTIASVDFSTIMGVSIGEWGAPPGQVDGFGDYGWLLDFGEGGAGIDDFGPGIDGTIIMLVDGSGLNFGDFFIFDPLVNDGPAVLKFQSLEGFEEPFDGAFGLGSFDPVPEPATLGLLFMGIVGIAATRLRRRTT